VALAAALLLPHPASPTVPAPTPALAAATLARTETKPLAAPVGTPHGITDFDREALMTPKQLIARWNPLVMEASKRFGISPDWIRAVIRQESGGRTMLDENLPIISTAGAMGIMQVMPKTYAEMRRDYRLGADPYDPHDNIIAGTALLKQLYGVYGYPAMFAAYNDGAGNLNYHLANGTLPDETRNYVNNIAKALGTPGAFGTATLTRPDGSPVDIDVTKVIAVKAALPGEYAPGVQAVLTIGKQRQAVTEPVMLALAKLRSHGARI
jgi:hypothetical protein